jgi:beta-lactamase regulating signal transducer with metallopeptidase domain/protocatechuate 3,4-dioxygenase beta subunit
MLDSFATSLVVRAIGWALLQSLWQGALVGVLTALALVALRRSTAGWRYGVACAGLLALALAPIVTAAEHADRLRTFPPQAVADEASASRQVGQPLAGALRPAESGRPSATTGPWWSQPRLEAWSAGLVLAWLAGVFALFARLLGGWIVAERLRRAPAVPLPGTWHSRVRALACTLGVERPVRIVTSRVSDVPMVIGWLRPVILLPCAALAGLSPTQLEAVIAHELAHIRRHDYLVNLLQTTVETLLFYHPVMWWLSRRIRLEREHCCDDVAVQVCGDRVTYARALADLEEMRSAVPALGMAATGGPLVGRVRRLLGLPPQHDGDALTWLVVAALLTALSLALTADERSATPPPDAARLEPAQTASPGQIVTSDETALRGRIVDAASGQPITGASVTVALNGEVTHVTTDAGGRYEVLGPKPGDYRIYAEAAGYVLAQYGQRYVLEGGEIVEVRSGQTVSGVDVALQPGGIVSGRIIDESGAGVFGVEIVLLRDSGPLNGAGPFGRGWAQTDSAGTFRVDGLEPGQYYVRAHLPQPIQSSGGEVTAPTFFPQTTRLEEAQPVYVSAGLESFGVEFALASVETFNVSGIIVDSAGRPVGNVEVAMIQDGGGERLPVQVSQEGSFTVERVVPGEYTMMVFHRSLRMTMPQQVTVDRDVSGLELVLRRGAEVAGRVVRDGLDPLPFDPATIHVNATRQMGDSLRIQMSGSEMRADGSFSLHVAGPSVLQIEDLPTGWTVKSVRLRGSDITDAVVDFGEGTTSEVEIVVSDRVTDMVGRVSDRDGRAVSSYTVVVFPADAGQRNRLSRRLQGTHSRHDGGYQIEALPPGDYLAIAVEALPRSAWTDPAVLDRLEPFATAFRLREGERRALDLRLSPLPDGIGPGF